MSKLRTALSLPAPDLALTAEAALLLLGFAAFIRAVPPRYWRRWAARPAVSPVTTGDTPHRVRRAILRALRNMPVEPNCLPQALTACTMLRRRGAACALHIGASRSESGPPRFHAWAVADGLWVTGECDESRFAPFVLPPHGRRPPPCEAPARLASRTPQ